MDRLHDVALYNQLFANPIVPLQIHMHIKQSPKSLPRSQFRRRLIRYRIYSENFYAFLSVVNSHPYPIFSIGKRNQGIYLHFTLETVFTLATYKQMYSSILHFKTKPKILATREAKSACTESVK
jgi:hypothetical protein